MKIKKVNGIMLYLEPGNLEKAAEWFKDKFGATIAPEMTAPPQWGHRAIGAWMAMDTPDPYRLELSECIDDKLIMGRQLKRQAPCYGSLGIEVENLDEAIAELRAKGVRVSDKQQIFDETFKHAGGTMVTYEAMIHPKSCFGVIIELIEYGGQKAPPGTF